ncbi:MAG TPA: GspE/PulE family protein [Planctomycetota bacterium]|jgi:type II secretory ATPase GspE/PulE/Tfp pilus assembly ATPase PilB-like protein
MDHRLLGEILADMGCASAADVEGALEKQLNGCDGKIGELLVAAGVCQPSDIMMALADQYHMEVVDLESMIVSPEVLNIVPQDVCRQYHIFPVALTDGVVTIAVSDPLDISALDSVKFRITHEIEPVLATREAIEASLEKYFKPEDALSKHIKEISQTNIDVEPQIIDIERNKRDAEETFDDEKPIIKLVSILIAQAVQHRASDIHIEPMMDRLRVRYRVDGNCYEVDSPPKRLQGSMIARIKILANLNIAEKRLPQDGKIQLRMLNRRLDLRVSTLPASHGESVVMRILDKASISFGLEQLGFHNDDMNTFRRLLKKPNGIILITGPTGSGKTTTLYSALNELNKPDRKIITVENPVEYTLDGVNQCQVSIANDPNKSFTFAKALRAMLRQAPNIILIGEIRDAETAHIAIEAALTGHLVFATLHTNDAPSAVTRLIDMGIPPFLVASSVQAVQAQRLIRTFCRDCKRPVPPDSPRLRALGVSAQVFAGRMLYGPGGCELCHGTGFKGRKGIYEIMVMNSRLREMAVQKATTDQLRDQARRDGMHTLLDDGIRKVIEGWTTLEEVLQEARQLSSDPIAS